MSISYGWQGDLAQVGCDTATVDVIDDNLAKLAAAGVSVVISSGDSGSGYTTHCTEKSYKPGVEVTQGSVRAPLCLMHQGTPSLGRSAIYSVDAHARRGY